MTRRLHHGRSRRRYYPGGHPYRYFHPGRAVLLVLLAVLLLGGWEGLAATFAFGFPLLMVVLLGLGTVSLVRFTRRVFPPPVIAAPLPAPPPPRPDWRAEWSAAHQRFTALRAEYAGYECDPLAVLERPALADVTVPATARFVDAFAEAQALDTDQLPPRQHAEAYRWAVDKARAAWGAAVDAADRIQLSRFSDTERAAVRRVIKLLTVAQESGNDAERHAAYAKARGELAKLERSGKLRMPRPATATLDTAARGALPEAS